MLALALALLAGPVDEPAPRPFALPRTSTQTARQVLSPADVEALVRRRSPGCSVLLQHAAPQARGSVTPSVVANQLPQDPQANVKMYYLLDRYIDGCRAPMIVVDRLPQADQAIGRVIGPR